jgi:hypothetical protein
MNKEICWNCKKEFEYDGEKYRDIICPHCGILNSFYDPAANEDECKRCKEFGEVPKVYCSVCSKKPVKQELTKEEESMINYGDEKYQGRIVFMPVMGETAEFDIVEISEVKCDNPKMNFKDKVPVTSNGEQVVDDDGEPVFKEKDLGYHVEAKLKNGKILSIGSLSQLQQVFKKFNVQDGDKIRVFHKDKGLWEVVKL